MTASSETTLLFACPQCHAPVWAGATTGRMGIPPERLALVKRIVEAHDARVEVESQPNPGSTFAFELPLGMGLGTSTDGHRING